MKKKILLFLVCVNCISFASMAQLTTGNTTSSTVRTGNRAEAGDFGLYLGVSSGIFKKITDNNFEVSSLPIINFKYMGSDELELRLGIELNKYSTKTSESVKDLKKDSDGKAVDVDNAIYPGLAYHFSKLNILDVYVGAELPLGYTRYNRSEESKIDGKTSYDKTTRTAFNIGAGAFIGLQAYVANLPLAIGFEYGIYGRSEFGLQYKNETKSGDNKAVTKYSAYPNGGFVFDDLSISNGALGNQLRFTLTYFFN